MRTMLTENGEERVVAKKLKNNIMPQAFPILEYEYDQKLQ